eukprot:CAMPEP_0180401232 /NCGR_PEP_ID=MMETSP0989-20121125/38178_1 /TAXON_ID=697907 /ORGANISM="non described non described, Strain CCMP2293" /LENGTH=78 /DNA_ID=CAMNT_0022404179 /DNA_START=1 /DNA_END=237 /DNA_ORIENTATION=-
MKQKVCVPNHVPLVICRVARAERVFNDPPHIREVFSLSGSLDGSRQLGEEQRKKKPRQHSIDGSVTPGHRCGSATGEK